MLDKDNQHLFLEDEETDGGSFIGNVNKIANNLIPLQELNDKLTPEEIDNLLGLTDNVNKVGGNLPVVATGTVEARKLSDRFSDIVNVKDFGAKGDGITDDTEAIQAAIDKGGCVFFPAGIYRCEKSLTATEKNGLSLIGSGCDSWDFPSHPKTQSMEKGTVLLFCGTGSKQYVFPNITATYEVNDPDEPIKYKCLDLGEAFSSGLFFDNCQNLRIENLRVQLNYNGVTGYNDATLTGLGDSWDVGILMANCSFYAIRDIQCVGYWRMTGTAILNVERANQCAQGVFGVIDHSYFQGFRGLVYRSEDVKLTTNVGVAGSSVTNCVITDIAHKSRLAATALGFSTAGAALEISGAVMRDIEFINTHMFGADCIALLNDCDDIHFSGCFFEPFGRKGEVSGKFLAQGARFIATNLTSRLFFNETTEINATVDFAPYYRHAGGTRYTQSSGLYNPATHLFLAYHGPGSSLIAPVTNNSFMPLFVGAGGDQAGYRGLRICDRQYTPLFVIRDDGRISAGTLSPGTFVHFVSPYDTVTANANMTLQAVDNVGIQLRATGDKTVWTRIQNNGSNFEFQWSDGQNSSFTSRYAWSTSSYRPSQDNTSYLGVSSQRWKELFCANATINTSDAREKVNLSDPNESLMKAWGKVDFKAFQFIDAVEKKGSEEARVHFGVIAQQVQEAFASEGLDASKYALFCYDKWDDEYEDVEIIDVEATYDEDGNELTPQISHIEKKLVTPAGDRYGIRYSEALALEAAYQRWLGEQRDKEIAELKAMSANSKPTGYTLS